MDDNRTIALFLEGDPLAIHRVRQWILASCTNYRGRLGDAVEDISQDVQIALLDSIREGKFQADSSFRTYVRAFAHHKCIDLCRAGQRRTSVALADVELVSEELSPPDALERQQNLTMTLQVLQDLPPGCREVLVRLGRGMRYAEIAQELGATEEALRARVSRCRRRARELRDSWSSSSVTKLRDDRLGK
ncbi:MAG: sigma-70 family RNA polymerase sigma factor [Thermoanaerobaculia bacterium]|nr:sigma-70 family RNA polymerase sigma factor [Thermoanaerobaculia bacterium]